MALINHIDEAHDYKVAIPWESHTLSILNERETQWNDASVYAMERFGLPGDRYTCRITQHNIEFWFKDEQDALLFQIRWSSL
jgi:hypothetical protein